ncbi:MAG: ABC transporter permease subunit [Pseudomonadota bacterium]
MSAIRQIIVKEIRDGLRNRWIAALIVVLAGLALVLALLGAAPGGEVKASALSVTVVSLASLSVYLLPLIALMLSYDAIVGEAERGTLLLLLSYPVARWQVALGKFLGHLAILTLAILIGYGGAGVVVALLGGVDAEGWHALAALCASSVLLGAVFIAIGICISVVVEEHSKAAGLALTLWLVLVVLYDLGLLGALLLDSNQSLSSGLFTALLLANPTDAFRVFNLTLVEGVREAGGLAGLGAQTVPHPALPLGLLALWTATALGAATALFIRKEI